MASIARILQKNLGKPEVKRLPTIYKPFNMATIDNEPQPDSQTQSYFDVQQARLGNTYQQADAPGLQKLSEIADTLDKIRVAIEKTNVFSNKETNKESAKKRKDKQDKQATGTVKDFFKGVSAGFKAFLPMQDLEPPKEQVFPGDVIRKSIKPLMGQVPTGFANPNTPEDVMKLFATIADNSKKQLSVLEDMLFALYSLNENVSAAGAGGPNIPLVPDINIGGPDGKRVPEPTKPKPGKTSTPKQLPKIPLLGRVAAAATTAYAAYEGLTTASEIENKQNEADITKNQAFAAQSANLGGVAGAGIGASIGAGLGAALGGPAGSAAGAVALGYAGQKVGQGVGYVAGKIGQGLYENIFGHDKQHLAKMYDKWPNLDPSLKYAAIEANVPPPDSSKIEDIEIWQDQVKLKAQVDRVKIPSAEEIKAIMQRSSPQGIAPNQSAPTPIQNAPVSEVQGSTELSRAVSSLSEVQGSTELSRAVSSLSSSNNEMGSNPVIVIQQPAIAMSNESTQTFTPISANPRNAQLSSFTRAVIDANYMG